MHGLGDGIYSRAVIRQYKERYDVIYLETPWPQIWHDMPELHLLNPSSPLRTQNKNSSRGNHRYEFHPSPFQGVVKPLWYYSHEIRIGKWDSLPNAMLGNMGCSIPGDYRLPVVPRWTAQALEIIGHRSKPVMIYRPLTFRTEWRASGTRNPDRSAYVELFNSIRDQFFVVSIADVDDQMETIISEDIGADLTFHRGELDVETIIGMFSIADCVYSAAGFALAMAQAVETPSIIIFGGHESSKAYRSSATFAPVLMIDPINPCDCFDQNHICDKRIDVDQAKPKVRQWVENLLRPGTTMNDFTRSTKLPA